MDEYGWWVHGSVLERMDQFVSMSVFTLELGYFVELVLLAPATWFGLPHSAFTLSLLASWWFHAQQAEDLDARHHVQALLGGTEQHWATDSLLALGLTSWESLCLAGLSVVLITLWAAFFYINLVRDHIDKVFLLTRKLFLPITLVSLSLARCNFESGGRVTVFFVTCWIIAQILNQTIKVRAARRRPLVVEEIEPRLSKVRRHFPSVKAMLSRGETSRESFPSGDTVGAACFSCVLYIIKAPTWTYGLGLVTAFGRMYFHAHHFLDVSIGYVIGWMVPWGLNQLGLGVDYFDVHHTALILVASLGYFKILQRFKPPIPAHLEEKWRRPY